jgi:amino acid adenylation domain-containing protein
MDDRDALDGLAVHEVFAARASASAHRVAVSCDGRSLTYAELDAASDRLAWELVGLGVGPGSLVGLYVERSVELMVGLLGVLKAGGAYVPLDPAYPAERLAFMLEDAQASVLVTTGELAAAAPAGPEHVVCLDALAPHPAGPPPATAGLDDLAYVIYTSGSTGRPKGVLIEHRSLVNLLAHMATEPGLQAGETMLGVTTFAFDLSVPDLYLPLFTGATLALARPQQATDPAALGQLIAASGASLMQATPSTWRMLLDDGWTPPQPMRAVIGGEAVPPELAARLRDLLDGLWNFYGPTETTVWSTSWSVGDVDGTVPIGRPIANTTIHLLDTRGDDVPTGAVGELCIGGAGLARGYHQRPDLTAEKFTNHPIHGRIYKTGDLARLRPDGQLEYHGRTDHQVKLRGHRIELGEIEVALARHPDVAETVVVGREDDTGEQRLVAFVTLTADAAATRAELRRSVQDVLPPYMVPSSVVVLDAMPRTPNGKTDRKALPAVDWSDVERDTPYVAPSDELERQLARLWEEVLRISPIGVHDDLFSLGVDSLTAARLMARIERELDTELPVGVLFSAPTISQLAGHVRGGISKPEWPSLVAITPIDDGSTQPPLFCVHGGAGTVLFYAGLARALGAERPVYALHAQGLYGHDAVHTTVGEMAAAYVPQMRDVQPHGPYAIVGYCFGGQVAHEIAVRLRAQGEEVDFVGHINSPSVAYNRVHNPVFDGVGPITGRGGVKLRDWATAPGDERPQERRPSPPRRLLRRMRSRAQRWRLRALMALRRPLPAVYRENATFQRLARQAQTAYEPPVLDARTVVWRAEGLYFEEDLGWRPYVTGEIVCVEIPGDQATPRMTMDEPFVGRLAESIVELREERASLAPHRSLVGQV